MVYYKQSELKKSRIMNDKEIGGRCSLRRCEGDGMANASDEAVVLIAAAAMGAGEASGLTDAQMTAADVNTELFNKMLIEPDLANL